MLSQLKNFLRHSFIYSINNIASKAIGVILLPVYTSFISVAEFGTLAIVEVTLAIGVEVFSFGQSQAILLFDNLQLYKKRKHALFFSSTVLLVVVGCIGIILVHFFLPSLNQHLHFSELLLKCIPFISFILALRILNDLFLSKLRSEERSVTYAAVGLVKLTVTLLMTVYFVAFQKIGVVGVLYAYVIGDGLACVVLLVTAVRSMELKFDSAILWSALQIGFPLVLGSLAGMVLNVSDRYIIRLYRTSEEVALYDLGYRVAGFLNMFVIMPFSTAWAPNALKMYEQPNAKRYFSKIMTYMTFMLSWVGLALSLFGKELIKTFALNSDYWPSYTIVPIVTLAYVFLGLRLVSVLGMYLTKQTRYIGITMVLCAGLNVGANFLLIPKFGMIAAAYTTLGAFFLLHVASNIISNRFYKIPFEQWKLLLLICLGIFLFVGVTSLPLENRFIVIAVKAIAVIIFPFALYPFGFYEKIELETLRNIITKNPAQWFAIITNYGKKNGNDN